MTRENTSLEEQVSSKDPIMKSLKDRENMLHIKNENLEDEMGYIYTEKGELDTNLSLGVESWAWREENDLEWYAVKAPALEADIILLQE